MSHKNPGVAVERAAIAKRDADRAAFTAPTKRARRFMMIGYVPQFPETPGAAERRASFADFVQLQADLGLCDKGEGCGDCWDRFTGLK